MLSVRLSSKDSGLDWGRGSIKKLSLPQLEQREAFLCECTFHHLNYEGEWGEHRPGDTLLHINKDLVSGHQVILTN